MTYRAKALRALGRTAGACAALLEARAVGMELTSRRTLMPALSELASLAAQLGRADEAQAYRVEARAVVAYIAEHMPPELCAGFFALPHVRSVTEEDTPRRAMR